MSAPSFKEFVLDQLQVVGDIRCRAMFGGHGLYQSGTFFGIIFGGRLFFKTDNQSRIAYESRRTAPFTYESPTGKKLTMSYHEVPADILENSSMLIEWANGAISSAKSAIPRKHAAKKQLRPRSVTES